jgi:protein-serine/threonine kinase
MLAAPTWKLAFDNAENDDRVSPPPRYPFSRAGTSWTVTSIGRGFDWSSSDAERESEVEDGDNDDLTDAEDATLSMPYASPKGTLLSSPIARKPAAPQAGPSAPIGRYTLEPLSISPTSVKAPSLPPSRPPSRPLSPAAVSALAAANALRSPSSPTLRPRRRSSQQRVSLFAGRVSITAAEIHNLPPTAPPKLVRSSSTASMLSTASSVGPPPPTAAPPISGETSDRSISEFVIQGEIGRGAYGLVKKAREMQPDGTLGVRSLS